MVYTDYDAMLADPDVALLAEGVDRNTDNTPQLHEALESPSSRRAWIEIAYRSPPGCHRGVALLAEGVDRNSRFASWLGWATCRPPRGGRG